MIKSYFQLTKPGIIFGNMIPAFAGFFIASRGVINFGLLAAMIFGTSCVIASACVFNNYIDRDIDKQMARTKKRAMVTGLISGRNALTYGGMLGVLGIFILFFYTNFLTTIIGLTGFFVYVVLYGISKRRSPWGTIIGSIAGATPPVAGYCAVTNRFDTQALILFLILVFWQMPHFYAIAIYRLKDYTVASIPVLPMQKGIFITKIHMLLYTIAFSLAALSLTIFKFTGFIYLIITTLFGCIWIGLCIQGFRVIDDARWARKMFFFSLIMLIILCVTISIGSFF